MQTESGSYRRRTQTLVVAHLQFHCSRTWFLLPDRQAVTDPAPVATWSPHFASVVAIPDVLNPANEEGPMGVQHLTPVPPTASAHRKKLTAQQKPMTTSIRIHISAPPTQAQTMAPVQ